MKFVMTEDLKEKLEQVRALLGPKAYDMSFADLIGFLAEAGLEKLKTQKFGKKRSAEDLTNSKALESNSRKRVGIKHRRFRRSATPTSESQNVKPDNRTRYIPKKMKHKVWHRDKGKCQLCSGKTNLQYDHIVPYALGGPTSEENLRLLCFHCNQRQTDKIFGVVRKRKQV